MDIKPLTTEAVALTEKKMDMTLEDIIKMSKKPISQVRRPRVPIKNRGGFLNGGNSQVNSSLKAQRFVDSRSSMRQGVLAQKRSNFRVNQFPLAIEAARKAAQTPIRNRVVNWNKPSSYAPAEGWGNYLYWQDEDFAKAEATDIGLAVCRHEGTEAENLVSAADEMAAERRPPEAAAAAAANAER